MVGYLQNIGNINFVQVMFGYIKIPNVYTIGSLILMTAVTSEGLLVSPRNTAVVVGSRTTLNCSSSDSAPLWLWKLPNYTNVAYSSSGPGSPCVVVPSFASSYAVSAPSVGSSYCDLIILNATSAEAGSYSCSDGTYSAYSVLVVLDSGPQCSTDAVHDTVVYPDKVTMNCSVQYNPSSGWIPSLQWSPTGSTTSGSSGTTAYSTLTYNTGASTPIPSYSCSVVYNSSVFVDIPSCSTNPVTVLWCPTAVTISGASDGYIAYGSSLTCSASGNPYPIYQWFNSTNNLLATGPSLIVYETGNYTCTALNFINGRPCSTFASQFVNVTQTTTLKPTTTQTPPTTTVSSLPCVNTDSTSSNGAVAAAIVLGILLALSLICIVILIVYIVILKRNHAAGDKTRIYEAPQNTNNRQEASSTMYTSLELPTLQEGSEIRGRGKQSIYEVPINKNVEPEASSTMYTPLELPGKQGGASKEGLYENSLKTR